MAVAREATKGFPKQLRDFYPASSRPSQVEKFRSFAGGRTAGATILTNVVITDCRNGWFRQLIVTGGRVNQVPQYKFANSGAGGRAAGQLIGYAPSSPRLSGRF